MTMSVAMGGRRGRGPACADESQPSTSTMTPAVSVSAGTITPDDTDATVAMKANRTAIALHPSKRIAAVLGEQALRTRRGTPQEHADQLNHLLSLMRLPFVSVGIIPADA